METYDGDPDKYVEENRDLLIQILKHGDEEFVRALAIAALIEYGTEADIEDVQRKLERAHEGKGGAT